MRRLLDGFKTRAYSVENQVGNLVTDIPLNGSESVAPADDKYFCRTKDSDV